PVSAPPPSPPAIARPPVAAAPAQVRPAVRPEVRDNEPPPWLDVPFDDEPAGSSAPMPEPDDEPRARSAGAPSAPVPVPMAATPVPSVDRTPLGDRWNDIFMQMVQANAIGALVRELALQGQCIAVDEQGAEQVWRLRVERETLRADVQRNKLQAALATQLGRPVRLEVEPGVPTDSPALRAAAERARRQAEAEQIIHNDPLVQALMQQFKTARIVPGSVKPH
ncbi:DNA polymerase III subunit gamma/tau C-terminal domain-containing protein, partial [Rhizobacter sp. P5_C2]